MAPEDPNHEWLKGGLFVVYAFVAGVLGHIFRMMDVGKPVQFWPTLVQAWGAGFVGLLVMWLCQIAGLSQQWTAVTVGVSGWLGATATIQVLRPRVDRLPLLWRQNDGKPDR